MFSDFQYRRPEFPVLEGPNDKLYFLSGFTAALGVLTGSIDVDIPEGTPSYDVIKQIVNEELPRYSKEIARLQEQARTGRRDN